MGLDGSVVAVMNTAARGRGFYVKPVVLARALACASVAVAAIPSEARFLQVDPVGYTSQINLYGYVGDDPINRVDPTGLYDCNSAGTRLCESDQKQAIRELSGSLRDLNKLSRDLQAGNKLSASERNIQGRLDKYLGAGAGRNLQTINKLIGAGNTIMGVLRSNAPIASHAQVGTALMQTRGGLSSPFPTLLFPRYVDATENTRVETFIHEPAHKALGAQDYAYGSRASEELARSNPAAAFRNADNIAFALGFTRDDD